MNRKRKRPISRRTLLKLVKAMAITEPFVDETCFTCPRCRVLTRLARRALGLATGSV